MNRIWKTILGVLCVVLIVVLIAVLGDGVQNFSAKYKGYDLTADVTGLGRSNTYDGYLQAHASAPSGGSEVAVDIAVFEGDGELRQQDGAACVYTPDSSVVTWKVNVETAGMYNVMLDYLTVDSRGVDMERALYINGELPFAGAGDLTFSRLWTDGGEVRKDNQGNDVRPTQVEVFDWQQVYCQDSMGYSVEPYQFYFEAGESTISLEAINEPMILRGITLSPVRGETSYADYRSAQPAVNMSEEAKAWQVAVQGEKAVVRSSPSLYARYDRSSPDTYPNSVTNTVFNYIGGDPWNKAGQWIEWEFEVPEDGYYAISVKARQAYQRGAVSSRSLYIDGKIPFEEVKTIAFDYNTSWDMNTLSDENGKPYQFYLSAGKHTVRLQATLGEMGGILNQLEDSIYRLNLIYRKLLVLTGVNPDQFRDYNIAGLYPEVLDAMDLALKTDLIIIDRNPRTVGTEMRMIVYSEKDIGQTIVFRGNSKKSSHRFCAPPNYAKNSSLKVMGSIY